MMSTTDYNLLVEQARALFDGIRDQNANAANLSALVYHGMDRLNWVGFYWWKGSELILGPFQGRPACVRIAMGRGVCGTALQERRVQRVGDVHAFAGHIACDPRSRSEVVIPLFVGAHALGVFDLDSSMVDRFTEEDQAGLERLAALFLESMEPETGRFR